MGKRQPGSRGVGGIARILLPLSLSAIHSLCGLTLSLAHPGFLRLIYTVIGSEKAVVQETMLNQADCRGQGGKGKMDICVEVMRRL